MPRAPDERRQGPFTSRPRERQATGFRHSHLVAIARRRRRRAGQAAAEIRPHERRPAPSGTGRSRAWPRIGVASLEGGGRRRRADYRGSGGPGGGGGGGARIERLSGPSDGGIRPRRRRAAAGSTWAPRQQERRRLVREPRRARVPASPGRSGSQSGGMRRRRRAGFIRAARAAPAQPGADPALDPNACRDLSDEDVGQRCSRHVEARLRHAIAADREHHRARADRIVPIPGHASPPSAREGGRSAWASFTASRRSASRGPPGQVRLRREPAGPGGIGPRARRAAAKGHEDTVATLLASGADIRAMARSTMAGTPPRTRRGARTRRHRGVHLGESTGRVAVQHFSVEVRTGRRSADRSLGHLRSQAAAAGAAGSGPDHAADVPARARRWHAPPGAGPTATPHGPGAAGPREGCAARSLLLATETEVTAARRRDFADGG